MKLKITRYMCGNKVTLGTLSIDGNAECFCLEDQDRQLETNPDAKVMHETCIPRGTYKVIISYSNRFKRELPLLVDVPGFSGVRIHPGNTQNDSSGCVLVGTSTALQGDGTPMLINSREAFRKIFEKIEAALDRGDDVTVEIV